MGGGVPEGREEVGNVVDGMRGVRVEVAGEGRLGPGVGEQVGWWRWRGWLDVGGGKGEEDGRTVFPSLAAATAFFAFLERFAPVETVAAGELPGGCCG